MGENRVKEKNNTILILIIIILSIAVLYLLSSKQNSTNTKHLNETNSVNDKQEENKTDEKKDENKTDEKKDENKTNEQKNENKIDTSTNKECSTAKFDLTKSINSSSETVYRSISSAGHAGIWASVDSTQKTLTFSFTPNEVTAVYPLSWTKKGDNREESRINFEKKIVDIYFGGVGPAADRATLFILLEDGTVEYIPLVHMFDHMQSGVVSYGKINGVSDVIRFAQADVCHEYVCSVTTLAIRSDGTFYDLSYAVSMNYY